MTPTDRHPAAPPPGPWVMVQRWHDLLFAHWRCTMTDLRPLIPAPLEIETFDGTPWIGVIPFYMSGVRMRATPPVPTANQFEELNVRTYVTLDGRPGVWFFSLDAANRLAVAIARTFWHLPYHHARMTLAVGDGELRHASERRANGALFRGTCRPHGEPRPATPGTLEHFLAERYLLYAQKRDGRLRRGQVHHAPYPLQSAELADWDESLLAAAGIERPAGAPLVHFASGVDVEVFALQ